MQDVPYGYCHCGCGRRTNPAQQTDTKRGYVKGEPMPYLIGHCREHKPVRHIAEDRGYETPCWIWQLAVGNTGYGLAKRHGHRVLAHRLAWEERYGPIPDGLVIDHLCRVRDCINPDHLEPVTHRENCLRGIRSRKA